MKKLFSLFAFFMIVFVQPIFSEELSLFKWGLDNRACYKEETPDKIYELFPWAKQHNPIKHFNFTKDNSDDPIYECIKRHGELWVQYKNECKESNKEPNKEELFKYKAEHDLYCTEYAKEAAPVLFFDFTGSQSDVYVLKNIEIETCGFETFWGGGFEIGEAWYDIVLRHNKGIKVYEFNKNLAINDGIGHLKLRFWSDNYDESHGWIVPMGLYVIKITFVFKINGEKEIKLTTETIAMDV